MSLIVPTSKKIERIGIVIFIAIELNLHATINLMRNLRRLKNQVRMSQAPIEIRSRDRLNLRREVDARLLVDSSLHCLVAIVAMTITMLTNHRP